MNGGGQNFGTVPAPSAPISSTPQPIISSPPVPPRVSSSPVVNPVAPKSRSKKPVILILSLLFVTIVGIIILFLVGGGKSKFISTDNALDKYGEYLESGQGEDKYFENLKNLYEIFLTKAGTDEKYRGFYDELKTIPDLINKAELLFELEKINDDLILEKYLSDGYNATLLYIRTFFEREITEDFVDYVAVMQYYYENLLAALKSYDEGGCLVKGTVSSVCAEKVEQNNPVLKNNIELSFEGKVAEENFTNKIRGSLLNSYAEIKEKAENNENE